MNIIARRRALKWNAETLAEKANLPYPTLRDIEAGISAGREENKAAIAKALGCAISELYKDGTEAEPPSRPASHLIKELIEAPERVPHVAVSLVLQELLTVAPEIRAAVLAVLYGDKEIAAPYATAARKRAQGSK